MADQKARPLAPHVQAAIAAGRGGGVQGKMGGVGGNPGAGRGVAAHIPHTDGRVGMAQRKEAPHVRDMSKQALESGRVGQSKVAPHEVGKQRKEAPHVQKMLGSVSAAGRPESGRVGQPKVARHEVGNQRKEAPHVQKMLGSVSAAGRLESGRVGQPKVARHEVGNQRKEAPHVQKMLGSVSAAGRLGQAKAVLTDQPGRRAVQRKEREAKMVWQVTHLVEAQEESLFGGKNWQANELPADIGQLTGGQKILVDDEDVFMSRRGANQEISERRKADANQELKNKWVGVRQVGGEEVGKDVYIREETIQYTQIEPRQIKPIDVEVTDDPAESLFDNLQEIQEAWIKAGKKRRRSIKRWDLKKP